MPSFLKLLSFLGAGFALASAAACAAPAGEPASSDSAVGAAVVEPGTFKLYATPHETPTQGCDVHTTLSLTAAGGSRASFREGVDGVCELFVAPNERDYRLALDSVACGSKIFKATRRAGGKTYELTLTDNRARICDDIVEARIVVEESDGVGPVRRLFSHDPAPAPETSTWLSIDPVQCGDNPWQAASAPSRAGSLLEGESATVDGFFRAKGIDLEQIGFAHPAEAMAVCAACSCPRGDTLVVHARSGADAARLVTEFGFHPLDGALTRSPTQCGSNPWETEGERGVSEREQLATWAAAAGAPVTAVGFLEYTEPMIVCLACQCPRGDTAVVLPKDALASSRLQDAFGWTPAR